MKGVYLATFAGITIKVENTDIIPGGQVNRAVHILLRNLGLRTKIGTSSVDVTSIYRSLPEPWYTRLRGYNQGTSSF